METACLRHTEIPHTSRLFSDFQYHFDRVKKYYAHVPYDPASYAAAASEISYPDERRTRLVAALRKRNGDSPSLDLLAKPGTVAVVTGQQVGLFSGPAYTIYKALTAARLASQLNARGIPAVPVFWIATEDHDLAEVNHSFVFGPDQQPVTLRVNGAAANQRPVGGIALTDPPIQQLRETLAAFPFGAEIADRTAAAYRPGATFGEAFQTLLLSLLGKYGLLFLDPLDEEIRRIAAPVLRQALQEGPELSQALLERGADLAASGYHAQVHFEAQTSLVFLLEQGRRSTLRRQNGDYISKDRRFSASELAESADHLSPNALLRPVVQDYLLPTVAYVGGPAELAYMAQSEVLYSALLRRMPVVLARTSITILDSRAAKLMDRYGLGLTGLFHGEDALREKIARKLVPEGLLDEFAEARAAAERRLDGLRRDLAAFDATLAAALDKSRAKILHQLNKLEQKTARETLRRDERANADARYLTGLIFPEKHLQERYYSILPFIAKYGLPLIDTLYEHVNLDCPDHKALVV